MLSWCCDRPTYTKAVECWRMAYENQDTPTALIFSRQKIEDLPEGTD